MSAERTVMMIWTSLRKPLGNSGRSARSVMRPASTASVEGRPSRRGKLPGILPDGVQPLLEVDRQREEVDIRSRLRRDTGRDQDDRFADGDGDRTVGLRGQPSRLDDQRLAADFYFVNARHCLFLFLQPDSTVPGLSVSIGRRNTRRYLREASEKRARFAKLGPPMAVPEADLSLDQKKRLRSLTCGGPVLRR